MTMRRLARGSKHVNSDSPNCRVESPAAQIFHTAGRLRQFMNGLMFRLADDPKLDLQGL
jgi:hypothetical protein